LQTNVSQKRIPAGKCKEILNNPKTQVASKKKGTSIKVQFLTGPMLMHLVKRSSACMWSYSSLTALPRRLLLWWASYTFMTTEEEQRIQGYSYNVITNDQSQTINTVCAVLTVSHGE
jgi:hypothetical protein